MRQHDTRILGPAELRARIDRGETGDKVAGFDSAAAPLGTDEEAAGTPSPRHPAPDAAGWPEPGLTPMPQDSIAPDASPAKPRHMAWWAIVGAGACAVTLLLLSLLWR